MILDVKDGMQSCNAKINKQIVQHYEAAKLDCIVRLATKADIAMWMEFVQEKIRKGSNSDKKF